MAQEIIKCFPIHVIDGIEPTVDEMKFDVIQHPELIGRPCDCGRLKYSEGKCPTCMGDRWKVIWVENNQ